MIPSDCAKSITISTGKMLTFGMKPWRMQGIRVSQQSGVIRALVVISIISFSTATTEVVSYVDRLTVTDLPLPVRKRGEGTNVGKAAQSFNVQSGGDNGVMVGYIMGNLLLPPKGIKDPESTGACSQVFTVCSCQPKAVEIAYGDPHEEEGSLNADTAQRFLLSAGDQFRIPPGNAYRLQNHSTTTDALFAWTIIRPRVNE